MAESRVDAFARRVAWMEREKGSLTETELLTLASALAGGVVLGACTSAEVERALQALGRSKHPQLGRLRELTYQQLAKAAQARS